MSCVEKYIQPKFIKLNIITFADCNAVVIHSRPNERKKYDQQARNAQLSIETKPQKRPLSTHCCILYLNIGIQIIVHVIQTCDLFVNVETKNFRKIARFLYQYIRHILVGRFDHVNSRSPQHFEAIAIISSILRSKK